MTHQLIFMLLLIGSCGYALWRGGSPERITGAALLLAAVGTVLCASEISTRLMHVERGIFLVDMALLVLLFAVALRADRAWPLLLAGLQLSSVGAHLAKAVDVEMLRVTYLSQIAIWSYPMVIALAIGTRRHRRRLRSQGHDLAWSLRSSAI